MKVQPILARATVHLPGLPLGKLVWVDPRSSYVQACLAAKYLVPEVEEDAQ